MKALQNFVAQKNHWNSFFNGTQYSLNTAKDRQALADMIDSALSPENLTCDGELPRSETSQGSRRRWPSGLLWPISSPTPSHRSAICGRRTPESVLHAVATARTTTRLFQDILRRGHR